MPQRDLTRLDNGPFRGAWPQLALLVVVSPFLIHVDSCTFQEDEFLCEDAGARIKECCGSLAGLSCTFQSGGDGCSSTEVDIRGPDADCIRSSSCEALIAAGACEITNWQGLGDDPCSNNNELCSFRRGLSCLSTP